MRQGGKWSVVSVGGVQRRNSVQPFGSQRALPHRKERRGVITQVPSYNLSCNTQASRGTGSMCTLTSHRYREQTSGYQWGERRTEGIYGGKGLRDTNYYV